MSEGVLVGLFAGIAGALGFVLGALVVMWKYESIDEDEEQPDTTQTPVEG